MPMYGGNYYSMDEMAFLFPEAYYGFMASGAGYDDPRYANMGNFFPAEDPQYEGGGGGTPDFSIDHTEESGPQYPQDWGGSWDWSTGQQDPQWNINNQPPFAQDPHSDGGGYGTGDPYENIQLPDVPWQGPPTDIPQPSLEPNFPPPEAIRDRGGVTFDQPPTSIELQPPGQPTEPPAEPTRPWWDRGNEDTGVDQPTPDSPHQPPYIPPIAIPPIGVGQPQQPDFGIDKYEPLPPEPASPEPTPSPGLPTIPVVIPPVETPIDPTHRDDGTGPLPDGERETLPVPEQPSGGKESMDLKDILSKIGGVLGIGGGSNDDWLKWALLALGPLAGIFSNTEGARTGTSSQKNHSTSTITTKKDLAPAQQLAMDQLSTLSSDYMTNPMKAVEPLRAPGMAQINKNYQGMPQSIANKTLAFGGNSGKFGKAIQGAEMGRINDFSDFEGGLAKIGFEGQMKGADIGSSLLSQDLGRTATTTNDSTMEGVNVGAGSALGGGLAGGFDSVLSMIFLDQLMKNGKI